MRKEKKLDRNLSIFIYLLKDLVLRFRDVIQTFYLFISLLLLQLYGQ